jgi:hypothetical protein
MTGSISLTGTYANQYSIVSGGGSYSISAGGNRQVTVRFSPTSTGSKPATLRITHNATNTTSPLDVPITGTGVPPQEPVILPSVSSLPSFGNVTVDTNSSPQNYTISGSNLTTEIVITAPTGFQISLSSGNGYTTQITLPQSGGSVPTTTIYARFSPTQVQAYSGNITHTSSGATTKNVAVSGTGIFEQFIELTSIDITPVNKSSVVWADLDNDGYLDLFITGVGLNKISRVYKNNGNNTFTNLTQIVLDGVENGAIDLADYDHDGYLDILLTGLADSGPISKIYRNNGNNTFSEQIDIVLMPVSESRAKWGDYDNDGKIDILMTGNEDGNAISKIYKNNGNNIFTEQSQISLTGVMSGSIDWGDYDNDGYLDILLTGSTSTASKIYHNNGNNTFNEQTQINLPSNFQNTAAWFDFDNDGDLDLIIASKIYINDGNGFSQQSFNIIEGVYGFSSFGDFDNDGDLDFAISGWTSGFNFFTKIYQNQTTIFTEFETNLTGVAFSSGAWADIDNDGDSDLFISGWSLSLNVSIAKLYRNNNPVANTPPTVPTNLNSSVNGQDVTFSWNKSTDIETPQNGLTYNLRIGTTPGGIDVISPMSDLVTGKRRIVRRGNTEHNNQWTIKGLAPGTYYWSVQAIDNCFAGSPFANEKTFTISTTDVEFDSTLKSPIIYQLLNNYPNPFNPSTRIEFGIPEESANTLKVYDITGEEVSTLLVNETLPAGRYSYNFEADNLPSGVYIYVLLSNSNTSDKTFKSVKKMILLK